MKRLLVKALKNRFEMAKEDAIALAKTVEQIFSLCVSAACASHGAAGCTTTAAGACYHLVFIVEIGPAVLTYPFLSMFLVGRLSEAQVFSGFIA